MRLDADAEIERQQLEPVPGALDYLPAIKATKGAAMPVDAVFLDHALKGRLKGFHSVIIGDLDVIRQPGEGFIPGADATFVAIYEDTPKACNIVMLRQHDDAY